MILLLAGSPGSIGQASKFGTVSLCREPPICRSIGRLILKVFKFGKSIIPFGSFSIYHFPTLSQVPVLAAEF